jgi:hypothetical protein
MQKSHFYEFINTIRFFNVSNATIIQQGLTFNLHIKLRKTIELP